MYRTSLHYKNICFCEKINREMCSLRQKKNRREKYMKWIICETCNCYKRDQDFLGYAPNHLCNCGEQL